jgi:hypothetical protein
MLLLVLFAFASASVSLVLENPNVPGYPGGFDMITDTIAIGDYQSSYDTFDVIVNLNYPHCRQHHVDLDGVPRTCGDLDEGEINIVHASGKTIYDVGLLDSTQPEDRGKVTTVIETVIPSLMTRVMVAPDGSTATPRILFHCFAGMSRSVTMAVAYLSKIFQHPLHHVDDYIEQIRKKRPIIAPNHLFMEEIRMYIATGVSSVSK